MNGVKFLCFCSDRKAVFISVKELGTFSIREAQVFETEQMLNYTVTSDRGFPLITIRSYDDSMAGWYQILLPPTIDEVVRKILHFLNGKDSALFIRAEAIRFIVDISQVSKKGAELITSEKKEEEGAE